MKNLFKGILVSFVFLFCFGFQVNAQTYLGNTDAIQAVQTEMTNLSQQIQALPQPVSDANPAFVDLDRKNVHLEVIIEVLEGEGIDGEDAMQFGLLKISGITQSHSGYVSGDFGNAEINASYNYLKGILTL